MIVMVVSPIEVFYRIEKLAKPVLELISEAVDAVGQSTTKREAARRLGTLAAKKVLLG